MKYYFSSDWHLGHANIIRYDKRPFDSVEEMDDTIIASYNSIVQPEDDFYFIGDFCMGNRNKAEEYLRPLKGNKFFIRGDHDDHKAIEYFKKYGTYLGSKAEIKVNGKSITLCHYSLELWNGCRNGSWHLFGHSHGNLRDNPNKLSFDVSANIWNYKPISFEQVEAKMALKTFTQQI